MRRAARCKYFIEQDEIRIGQYFLAYDRDHAFFKYFELKNRPGEKVDATNETF